MGKRWTRGQGPAALAAALASNTDECIEWPYYVGPRGYGRMTINGASRCVHVISCEMAHGPRPHRMEAAHSCNNKRCLNPRHLRWATHTENAQDRTLHGTQRRGETHNQSKLTEEQVLAIRRAYVSGVRQVPLSKQYGVTLSAINDIVHGRNWKHLPIDGQVAA